MNRSILAAVLFSLLFTAALPAQSPFNFKLTPVAIPNSPGLQSFAAGAWNGEWLLLGGRSDGLHQRQPFAAFDEASQNKRIYILNPATKQVWSAPLTSLPANIAEQLLSTNLEFTQRDSMLYLIGGYGYSATAQDHITHPQLLAVHMPEIISAIKSGSSLAPWIRALYDERMAVSGGQMDLLDGKFYLAGGQRFDGRYNPMNHPTFTQTYTDQVRIFQIEDDGSALSITNYKAWTDADHLHRRDYNMAAQIFPDGRPGLTLFSGVFQPVTDLPWLYPVDIDTSGYTPHPEFSQFLNHYHCANVSLYDAVSGTQHTVFFGGMAQYTIDAGGTLVQDVNVPFVRTIARVSRYADGSLEEIKLPAEMPELLGSGAEFFPAPDLPTYPNGVIRLDELSGDSILLGYIFGGIRSPQANIFFTNIASDAVPTVYETWLVRNTTGVAEQAVANPLQMLVSPNPSNGELLINYKLTGQKPVRIQIFNASGRLLGEFDEGERSPGQHFLKLEANGMPKGYLLVNLRAGEIQTTQKVLLE